MMRDTTHIWLIVFATALFVCKIGNPALDARQFWQATAEEGSVIQEEEVNTILKDLGDAGGYGQAANAGNRACFG